MSSVIQGVHALENENFEILRKSIEDMVRTTECCLDAPERGFYDKRYYLGDLKEACRRLEKSFKSFEYAQLLKLNVLVLKKDLEQEVKEISKSRAILN